MKFKQIIMLSILAVMPVLSGCSGDMTGVSQNDLQSEYSDGSSTAPFDLISEPLANETPNLQYLGSQDLTKSAAYELYINSYAHKSDSAVIEWERVSSQNLANRLTERISSDLSPDLCDKISNSFPYLTKKNLYEDLTEYIDITAPQWISYAEYITSSGAGKGQYFYPTSITLSPYVLLYSKSAFPRYNVADPLTLWHDGEWTFGALRQTLGGAQAIGGSSLAENFLASSGASLFSVDQSGKVTSNLHSESFADSAAFIAANCAEDQQRSYYLKSGIESLQSGKYVFLSITESELDSVRRDYPESDFEIVPFPRADSADKHYYYAIAEGYLVPKRAKNIKGAASFINCSRIAAQAEGTSNLLESDSQTLSEIRSADLSQAVFDTNYCLDTEANSSISSIFAEIYSNGTDTQTLDEYIKTIEAPILRSISEINQNTE